MPGIPHDEQGPVFREPWEAQAFAMALALQQRGLFTWSEWATALGQEIKRAQTAGDPDTGDTYYRHWLANLLDRMREEITPHIFVNEFAVRIFHVPEEQDVRIPPPVFGDGALQLDRLRVRAETRLAVMRGSGAAEQEDTETRERRATYPLTRH